LVRREESFPEFILRTSQENTNKKRTGPTRVGHKKKRLIVGSEGRKDPFHRRGAAGGDG